MQITYRSLAAGVVAYARWRDSTRTQHMKKVGVVWAERHGERWRNRRGQKPEDALTLEDALLRARELVAEHEAKLAGGADLRSARFEDVGWAWLAHGRDVSGWRPSTVEDREHTLRAHLVPAFGHRPVRSITRAEVRAWWDGLHNVEREGGRLSDRNANKLLAELRAIFNWALRREHYELASNPTEGIAMHKQHTSERPRFYAPKEIGLLADAAASEQDALAFKIAAFAGLRRGELVSLRWRHLDFARSSIYVEEAVSAGVDSAPKSGKGRTVPMAQALADPLKEAKPADASEDDLVLVGKLPGEKLDGSALRRRFIAARDRAGLLPLRFHDLRHTFGSLAVDAGASLVQVQAWMGHSAIQTTMRYLHTKSRLADANMLDRAFAVEWSPAAP
jgi:integrase